MPEKFIVPQFIDKEDRILGPITVRQFLISLATVFISFVEFRVLTFIYFIPLVIVTAGIGGVFAFVKINGQPFHIFFLNFLQTSVRAKLRVWDKTLSDAELRPFLVVPADETVAVIIRKPPPSAKHLRDLTLIVNTGGSYHPEEWGEEAEKKV
ncbi:MAG: PrgI family protein [bacterium]|nr:PrgI family protein [bacterium]